MPSAYQNLAIASRFNRTVSIEGEVIGLSLENGDRLIIDEPLELRPWRNADLTGVKGLDGRNAHFLKIMGALHVPDISYDPIADPEVNALLTEGKRV